MTPPVLPRILIVDDEVENLKALERTLRPKFDLDLTDKPQEALSLIEKNDYAVVISDQRMAGMLGTDLLAAISKKKPLTMRVILTAHTETKEILDAINRAEIYRYITKPWNNQELLTIIEQVAEHYRLLKQNKELLQNLEILVEKRTAELKFANEKLSELAMTDPLTKILNRRGFSLKFNDEIERCSRYNHSVALAMLDVDHFKHFNDTEGHTYGDEALKKIAQLLVRNLRKTDILARYGGEEFIIMMPETRLSPARDTCERLRMAIEGTVFQGQKEGAYLTLSIGLAVFPDHGRTPEELVKIADQALYVAKESGRNRVMLA